MSISYFPSQDRCPACYATAQKVSSPDLVAAWHKGDLSLGPVWPLTAFSATLSLPHRVEISSGEEWGQGSQFQFSHPLLVAEKSDHKVHQPPSPVVGNGGQPRWQLGQSPQCPGHCPRKQLDARKIILFGILNTQIMLRSENLLFTLRPSYHLTPLFALSRTAMTVCWWWSLKPVHWSAAKQQPAATGTEKTI